MRNPCFVCANWQFVKKFSESFIMSWFCPSFHDVFRSGFGSILFEPLMGHRVNLVFVPGSLVSLLFIMVRFSFLVHFPISFRLLLKYH
uniref:Uncharacterized protein n=1 Tax=Oryza brachyantha TaxID=4533 RepID=J3LES6_ORYBR